LEEEADEDVATSSDSSPYSGEPDAEDSEGHTKVDDEDEEDEQEAALAMKAIEEPIRAVPIEKDVVEMLSETETVEEKEMEKELEPMPEHGLFQHVRERTLHLGREEWPIKLRCWRRHSDPKKYCQLSAWPSGNPPWCRTCFPKV